MHTRKHTHTRHYYMSVLLYTNPSITLCIRTTHAPQYARMDATTDKVSRLHSKTLAYVQDISANVQMANRDLHTLSQLIRSHHDPDYRPPLHMHSKQQQEHLKALHIPKNSLFMQSVKLPGVDKSRHTLRNQ